MKIIEMAVLNGHNSLTNECSSDCNNCWEKCSINDGECGVDCDVCYDYFCRDYLD